MVNLSHKYLSEGRSRRRVIRGRKEFCALTVALEEDGNDHAVHTEHTSHDDGNDRSEEQGRLEHGDRDDTDAGLGRAVGCTEVGENEGTHNAHRTEEDSLVRVTEACKNRTESENPLDQSFKAFFAETTKGVSFELFVHGSTLGAERTY